MTAVDLLEQLRTALDDLDPLLAGRIVDIEMSRLRVLADPAVFRQEFAVLIESAVAAADPTDSITVRVTRKGKVAEIEIINERAGARSVTETRAMTVRLAPGSTSAADA